MNGQVYHPLSFATTLQPATPSTPSVSSPASPQVNLVCQKCGAEMRVGGLHTRVATHEKPIIKIACHQCGHVNQRKFGSDEDGGRKESSNDR